MFRTLSLICLLSCDSTLVGCAFTHDEKVSMKSDQAIELGKVHWNRDLESAKAESAKTEKPVLVLFQEVPG